VATDSRKVTRVICSWQCAAQYTMDCVVPLQSNVAPLQCSRNSL